jgi:hypothetical protein
MSPKTGRFLTRDPIGYADGSLLYCAYFANESTDPYGMQKVGGGGKKPDPQPPKKPDPPDFGKCQWSENGNVKYLTFEYECSYTIWKPCKKWLAYDPWVVFCTGESGIELDDWCPITKPGVATRGANHRCRCTGKASGDKPDDCSWVRVENWFDTGCGPKPAVVQPVK